MGIVCPVCGFDNDPPGEYCRRCANILPSEVVEEKPTVIAPLAREPAEKFRVSGPLRPLVMTFNFIRFAVRNVKNDMARSFLIILGLILSITFISGINLLVGTMQEDALTFWRSGTSVDARISHVNGTTFIATDVINGLKKDPSVDKVSPMLFTHANLTVNNDFYVNLTIIGIDPATHPDWEKWNIISGFKELGDNNILISEAFSNILGTKAGESLRDIRVIYLEDIGKNSTVSEEVFDVKGVIEHNPQKRFSAIDEFQLRDIFGPKNVPRDAFIIIHINRLRQLLSLNGDYATQVVVKLKTLEDVVRLTESDTTPFSNVINTSQYKVELFRITQFQYTGFQSYQNVLNIVVIIAIIVEFIFLLNLYIIVVADRQRDFGIYRSLGISKRQSAFIFLTEVWLQALIGSTLGVYLGRSLAEKILSPLASPEGLLIRIPPFSMNELFFGLALGLLVPTIAAIYPLRQLLNFPIVMALQERPQLVLEHSEKGAAAFFMRQGSLILLVLGVIFGGSGAYLWINLEPKRNLQIDFLSQESQALLLLILGIFCLQFVILQRIPGILKRLPTFDRDRLAFSVGTWNVARYRLKSVVSMMTSAIALAFTLTIVIMIASLVASAPTWFSTSNLESTDIVLELDTVTPPSTSTLTTFLNNQVANKSLQQYTFIQEIRFKWPGGSASNTGGTVVTILGANFSLANQILPLTITNDKLKPQEINVLTNINDNSKRTITKEFLNSTTFNPDEWRIPIILGESTSLLIKKSTGETFDWKLGNTVYHFIVKGVVKINLLFQASGVFLTYIPDILASTIFQGQTPSLVTRYLIMDYPNTVNTTKLAESFREDLDWVLDVIDVRSLQEGIKLGIQRQQLFMSTLTIQALLVGAITQFVAILISAIRTKRDVGMLRSIGLPRKSVFFVFLSEGALLGIFGVIFGVIDSVTISYLLTQYVSLVVNIVDFVLPYAIMGLWIVIYFAILLIFTWYPSYQAADKSVIAVIQGRDELFKEEVTYVRGSHVRRLMAVVILSFILYYVITVVNVLKVSPDQYSEGIPISPLQLVSAIFLLFYYVFLVGWWVTTINPIWRENLRRLEVDETEESTRVVRKARRRTHIDSRYEWLKDKSEKRQKTVFSMVYIVRGLLGSIGLFLVTSLFFLSMERFAINLLFPSENQQLFDLLIPLALSVIFGYLTSYFVFDVPVAAWEEINVQGSYIREDQGAYQLYGIMLTLGIFVANLFYKFIFEVSIFGGVGDIISQFAFMSTLAIFGVYIVHYYQIRRHRKRFGI